MTLAHWIAGPQLVGVIFIIVGLVSYYFPPKKINELYGYRTFSSKRNQQTWDAANRFSAIYSLKAGAIVLIAGVLLHLLIYTMPWPEKTKTLLTVILLLGSGIFTAVSLIVSTEKHLDKNFKE